MLKVGKIGGVGQSQLAGCTESKAAKKVLPFYSCITDGMPGTGLFSSFLRTNTVAGVDLAGKNEKQVVGDFVWEGDFVALQKGMDTVDLAAVFSFSYSYEFGY